MSSWQAFRPGQFVINPAATDWGLGQVQSAIGARVTVSFTEAGKVLIDTSQVALEPVDDPADWAVP